MIRSPLCLSCIDALRAKVPNVWLSGLRYVD